MEKRKTKKDIVKMLLRNNELDERDEEELIDLLFDQPIAIDVDKQEESKMTFGDKISDRVIEMKKQFVLMINIVKDSRKKLKEELYQKNLM